MAWRTLHLWRKEGPEINKAYYNIELNTFLRSTIHVVLWAPISVVKSLDFIQVVCAMDFSTTLLDFHGGMCSCNGLQRHTPGFSPLLAIYVSYLESGCTMWLFHLCHRWKSLTKFPALAYISAPYSFQQLRKTRINSAKTSSFFWNNWTLYSFSQDFQGKLAKDLKCHSMFIGFIVQECDALSDWMLDKHANSLTCLTKYCSQTEKSANSRVTWMVFYAQVGSLSLQNSPDQKGSSQVKYPHTSIEWNS